MDLPQSWAQAHATFPKTCERLPIAAAVARCTICINHSDIFVIKHLFVCLSLSLSHSLRVCVCIANCAKYLHVARWAERGLRTAYQMNTNKVNCHKSTLIFIFLHLHLFCQSICEIHLYVRALYMFYCAPLDLRCIYVLTRDCSSSQWSGREIHILLGFVVLLLLRREFQQEIPNKCFDSESCSTLFANSFLGHCCDCFIRLPIKLPDIRYRLLVCLSLSLSTRLFSGHCLVAPDAESWHCLSSPDWLPRDNKCITIVDLLLLMFLCSIFR